MAQGRCFLVASLALVTACGSADPPMMAPASPPVARRVASPADDLSPSERDAHIADALWQLRQAEEKIIDTAEKKKELRPHAGKPAADAPADASKSEESTSSAPPCDVACSALASMQRSAGFICKLAGDGDARCADARGRVRAAEARVTATCGACPRGVDESAP